MKIEKTPEELLTSLEPSAEEVINRKMKHLTFAKVIFFLGMKSKTTEFIYTAELSRFLKVSSARAYQILRELCDVGIMSSKSHDSQMREFHFVQNDHSPRILKYFDKAKKRLEIYFEV